MESLFIKVAGLKTCNFIKKETPIQMLSCEFPKILTTRYAKKVRGIIQVYGRRKYFLNHVIFVTTFHIFTFALVLV